MLKLQRARGWYLLKCTPISKNGTSAVLEHQRSYLENTKKKSPKFEQKFGLFGSAGRKETAGHDCITIILQFKSRSIDSECN